MQKGENSYTMSRSVRRGTTEDTFIPERPPKPKNLRMEANEPLYTTTLPRNIKIDPDTPPKLKGILKNGVKTSPPISQVRRKSAPPLNSPVKEKQQLLKSEDVRHFDLDIKEPKSVQTNEENIVNTFQNSRANMKTMPMKAKHSSPPSLKFKEEFTLQMPDHMKRRANTAARVESMAGIAHLIVIVMSIITLIVLAQLTNVWELRIRRCPLYVKTSKDSGVHWGNEKLAACHYAAYMPSLILVMSLSLILLHGGVLYAWRNGKETSILLVSKTYPKILLFIEILELIIAISVAGVILDGVRQTCLGFQLTPWLDERPENCRAGYQERDEVYSISRTYSKLLTAMVASIISVCMLVTTSIFYLIRIKPC